MESAAKIKEILQAASMEKLPEFIAEYENDPRSGVQKLVSGALKKIDALEKAVLLYTSPSPRDLSTSRMPSSA